MEEDMAEVMVEDTGADLIQATITPSLAALSFS